MTHALFLGCTVPVRALNYELIVRKVAQELGMELADVDDFLCCGYPIGAVSEDAAAAMAARNLAVAGSRNLSIACLCSACSGFLSETKRKLEEDEALLGRVNELLSPLGLRYEGNVEVSHFVRLLLDEVGEEKIARAIRKPLDNVSVAVHYGCHYLRPRSHAKDAEDPENPGSLERLVRMTGARTVTYENFLGCCGGGILGIKEQAALGVAGRKLDAVAQAQADSMITICPFCSVMFEGNQKKIEKIRETKYNLPVLYYPQLLGLAMGLSPDDLGFKMNRIKADALLEKLEKPL
ncbi:MAG: CoB--CoM heterodisulfide reductase iron-sulfur subunit B family protein [Pseudomonadota bacterium]